MISSRDFHKIYVYNENVYYQYVEHGSKNYQGRLCDRDSNKVSRIYAQPGFSHCPVRLIDIYLSKLPSDPKSFYMQLMQKIDHRVACPWYQVSPVEVNTLKNMMSRMSALAGLSNRYTNHGLRATACTRMFNAVPQKVIAEFSGHKSAKALQKYEHTSPSLLRAAGLAIKDEKQSNLIQKKWNKIATTRRIYLTM